MGSERKRWELQRHLCESSSRNVLIPRDWTIMRHKCSVTFSSSPVTPFQSSVARLTRQRSKSTEFQTQRAEMRAALLFAIFLLCATFALFQWDYGKCQWSIDNLSLSLSCGSPPKWLSQQVSITLFSGYQEACVACDIPRPTCGSSGTFAEANWWTHPATQFFLLPFILLFLQTSTIFLHESVCESLCRTRVCFFFLRANVSAANAAKVETRHVNIRGKLSLPRYKIIPRTTGTLCLYWTQGSVCSHLIWGSKVGGRFGDIWMPPRTLRFFGVG